MFLNSHIKGFYLCLLVFMNLILYSNNLIINFITILFINVHSFILFILALQNLIVNFIMLLFIAVFGLLLFYRKWSLSRIREFIVFVFILWKHLKQNTLILLLTFIPILILHITILTADAKISNLLFTLLGVFYSTLASVFINEPIKKTYLEIRYCDSINDKISIIFTTTEEHVKSFELEITKDETIIEKELIFFFRVFKESSITIKSLIKDIENYPPELNVFSHLYLFRKLEKQIAHQLCCLLPYNLTNCKNIKTIQKNNKLILDLINEIKNKKVDIPLVGCFYL